MSDPLIEQRKWFVSLVGAVALSMTYSCAWAIWHVLPENAGGAHIALILLVVGASGGWVAFLTRVLPMLLLKVCPRLEAD